MTPEYVNALLSLSRVTSPALIAAATEHLITHRPQAHCAAEKGVTAPNLARLIRRIRDLDLLVQQFAQLPAEPPLSGERIDFMLANFSRATSVPVIAATKRFLVQGESLSMAALAADADVHNVWRMICQLKKLNEKLNMALGSTLTAD